MNIIQTSSTEAYLEERPHVHLHFTQQPQPDIINRIQGIQIRDTLSMPEGETDDETSIMPVQGIDDRAG